MLQDPVLWIAVAVGLYMAWNIGANDVANAMGTSVGSKALTLIQAIIIAGVLEFAGASLVGAYVTDTVRKGIVDPSLPMFTENPRLLVYGMTAALTGAAVWLNVATILGWPVSTTHSIVGAVAGFGLVVGGPSSMNWGKLGAVVSSWIVSPLTGGMLSWGLYMLIRKRIIEREQPGEQARRHAPLLVAGMLFVLTLVMLFKGLKNLKLPLAWYQSIGLALGFALMGYLVMAVLRRRQPDGPHGLEEMERVFRYLQIATAAFVAFAHGANDVANAVGPMAAVYGILGSGEVMQKVSVPIWMLMLGGVGIVVGLSTYGYKVMATIGGKITEITPSRGFCSEFGAAMTILVGSKLGLPLSTTHTLVGSVIGVGFARGVKALDLAVIRNIVVSWLLTIPFAAAVCIAIFYALKAFL